MTNNKIKYLKTISQSALDISYYKYIFGILSIKQIG